MSKDINKSLKQAISILRELAELGVVDAAQLEAAVPAINAFGRALHARNDKMVAVSVGKVARALMGKPAKTRRTSQRRKSKL